MLRYWTTSGITEKSERGALIYVRSREIYCYSCIGGGFNQWFTDRATWPEALGLCQSLVFWGDRC